MQDSNTNQQGLVISHFLSLPSLSVVFVYRAGVGVSSTSRQLASYTHGSSHSRQDLLMNLP